MPTPEVTPPRVPPRLEAPPAGRPDDHERWDGVALDAPDWSALRARGVELVHARVTDADWSAASLHGLRLADVDVGTSNLANLMAIEGTLERCAFAGCRLTGFAWPQGVIEEARFTDCMLDLAAFGGVRFRRATFEGCVLRDADFREARLEPEAIVGLAWTMADALGIRSLDDGE